MDSQRSFAIRRIVAGVCCVLSTAVWNVQTPATESVIAVKASKDWNVTADDMQRLGELAGGVGWEFEPRPEMDEGLRLIGIRRIRCINVAPFPGEFDEQGHFRVGDHPRLKAHFRSCRAVGASPHMIIAPGAGQKDGRERLPPGVVTKNRIDWARFRNYCKALFGYVLIESGFAQASFVVGNEPDIAVAITGQGKGQRVNYEHYLDTYRQVAGAAREYEKENPGRRVRLGGPALAWAFSFRYGDFNWTERFLQDVGREKIKLDFLGTHFYGNLSPLAGKRKSGFPSFSRMMQMTRQWRDKYTPGVPIHMTEWGASYHTSNEPASVINGNHVGAAFAAAFLNKMLETGVDRAIYLVTTDIRSQEDGKWVNVWGWPSLFVNPNVHGFHSKAPYNVFKMLAMMAPRRVEAVAPDNRIDCIVSRDDKKRLTALVWNYHRTVQESGPGIEAAGHATVAIQVQDASKLWKAPVRYRRWLVSETVSNAYHLFSAGQPLDQRCELQQVDGGTAPIVNGMLSLKFQMPPSSVSLIEFEAAED